MTIQTLLFLSFLIQILYSKQMETNLDDQIELEIVNSQSL